jgi:hypothetical protein
MYQCAHKFLCMCIYYIGKHMCVLKIRFLFPGLLLKKFVPSLFQWHRDDNQKTFPVCLPSSFLQRRQFHVNSGFEVWDEECLNEPLVVDVTRGWGLMTAPQMNIRWESDPKLTASSVGNGRACRQKVLMYCYGYHLSVTNQPLSTVAHIVQQVKSNIKICPCLIRASLLITFQFRLVHLILDKNLNTQFLLQHITSKNTLNIFT